MKKFELDTPPPFLQGVYVRDDFEFDRCGSALRQDVSDPTHEAQPLPPEEPQLSAMMSDDDFLSSLLSPQPSEPTWAEPEESLLAQGGSLMVLTLEFFSHDSGDML